MDSLEFIEFFERDLFLPDFNAASKEAALKKLVTMMYKRQRIKNPKILLHTLLEREKAGQHGDRRNQLRSTRQIADGA